MERAKGRRKDCRGVWKSRAAIKGIGTQREIAELLGVHQSTVSRILAGKRKIRPETERKILREAA